MPCLLCGGPREATDRVKVKGKSVRACPSCQDHVAAARRPGGKPNYLNRNYRETKTKPQGD